jgi:hypothetical protein
MTDTSFMTPSPASIRANLGGRFENEELKTMATVPVTVQVAKEFHELGDGFAALVKTLKPALKDGFQPSDVPAIFGAVMALIPALKGVEQLPAEAKADPEAFGLAGVLLVTGVLKAIAD